MTIINTEKDLIIKRKNVYFNSAMVKSFMLMKLNVFKWFLYFECTKILNIIIFTNIIIYIYTRKEYIIIMQMFYICVYLYYGLFFYYCIHYAFFP